jgi:hypothetical protein
MLCQNLNLLNTMTHCLWYPEQHIMYRLNIVSTLAKQSKKYTYEAPTVWNVMADSFVDRQNRL